MRIQVKGRSGVTIDDELRSRVEKKLEKVARQVSALAELEIELREERNPAIRESQVAEATLHLKGVTLRACERSTDMGHSINLVADDLARQVKKHRDKRRARREAHRVGAGPRRVGRRGAAPGCVATVASMTILDRALRVGESKKFKAFEKNVARINDYEPELELESDDELRARYEALRERYLDGEALDELLFETFALTREAGKRALGQRHYDVQLIGGMVLHDGSIAEMKTGEGKTLTATLPIVLNALASRDENGHPVHGRRRPPGHGQRLPGPPRRQLDEADLRPARA